MRKRRRKPKNRLVLHTNATHIFIAGVLTIVAFLFQESLVVRVVQVAFFALLASLAGKRIQWGYFAIMVASITFFNLLTPVGRVLLDLGPLSITEGALTQGLLKGFAIVGLVFISLFAVRPDLRLPGSFGGLLARVFYYFERVLETRGRVSARHLVDSVDEILLDLYPPGSIAADAAPAPDGRDGVDEPDAIPELPARTDAIGAVIMAVVVVANVVLAVAY